NQIKTISFLATLFAMVCPVAAAASPEPGFSSLFDGSTLQGWTLVGKKGQGYIVQDEKIICPTNGGGNLFTEKEFGDFVLRFEFKLAEGSNNGIGIRAPLSQGIAYLGME